MNEAALAAELHTLGTLCGVDLDDVNTMRRAMVWCEEVGAASIDHVVEADMAEDFVKAIGAKAIAAKRLRAALQTTNSIRNVAMSIVNGSAPMREGHDGRGELTA